MNIHIVGMGYIGLPTAVFFANAGFAVSGSDVDSGKIASLQRGELPFSEPGFDELFRDGVKKNTLGFSGAVQPADVFILCVPTPVVEEADAHNADLSSLWSAVEQVIPHLREENLLVIESTVPVGTTDKVRDFVSSSRPDLNRLRFAYAPERVLPGALVSEMRHNSRLVGGVDSESSSRALELYRHLTEASVESVSSRAAEMSKLVENAFRDVNLAFANEISMLALRFGVDVDEVIRLANMHPRVQVLKPGPGVGGHCIPVDPWFLIEGMSLPQSIIRTARAVNLEKENWVHLSISEQIENLSSSRKGQTTVAVLGVSYKPNVGDTRESPALRIAKRLSGRVDVRLVVVDPHVPDDRRELHHVSLDAALRESQIVVRLVRHSEFEKIQSETLSLGTKFMDFTH